MKILPETAESQKDAAVVALRSCKMPNPIPKKTRIIKSLKHIFGEETYDRVHTKIAGNKNIQKIILRIEHKRINK